VKHSLSFLFLICSLVSRLGWGLTLFDSIQNDIVPLAEIQSQWSLGTRENQLKAVLLTLSSFDESWKQSLPHLSEEYLNWGVESCDSLPAKELIQSSDLNSPRILLACFILKSEWLNRISPWKSFDVTEKLENYQLALEKAPIPSPEKLYVEGRVYSSLPPLYGLNIKRALVALEMLKRMENYEGVALPWIERIRRAQGKWLRYQDGLARQTFFQYKETDGLPLSLFPLLTGNFPQGFGVQLRYRDSAIDDKRRSLTGRFFVTHRGSIGGEAKVEDAEIFKDRLLSARFQYLHGIQEHHGLGIGSPRESKDLYIDRGILDFVLKSYFAELAYFKVGYRIHSSHLRKVEGGEEPTDLPHLSNAFDSGATLEVGYDSRDSEYEPYVGLRASLQAYLPRKNFGSPRSFERLMAGIEDYRPLSTSIVLKNQISLVTVSDLAPFHWFSQASGSVPFSGVRPTRFMDRSLVALATEGRWKNWEPLTLFGYANMLGVGSSLKRVFEEHFKLGVGVGGEIHLTRFRGRVVRSEVGVFGGEFCFNMILGFPID
jgi:hypothetical protein